MIGLSDAICARVSDASYARLSAETIRSTKRVLLDASGVMLAASGFSQDVLPFVALATSQSAEGTSAVLGHAVTAIPALAALANGAMAHALDFEDAYDLVPLHPNASMVPAAIALTQSLPWHVDGTEFIAAIAQGCDLVCRLGHSLREPMEKQGWYPPMILGAFGAVAACARLHRLTPLQTRNAFSLLLCQLGGPGEIKHSQGTVLRAVREAFPAQAAVVSAQLASRGTRGFEEPFEGRGGFYAIYAGGLWEDEALLLDREGRTYIEDLSFKPWPACRGTHAYIEMALELFAQGIKPGDIQNIVIEYGEIQHMLVDPAARKRRPATDIDAKFSIFYTVARALISGSVTLDSFGAVGLADPELHALTARMTAVRRGDWGRDQGTTGAMTVHLKDGRQLATLCEKALGHPDRPMSDGQLLAKFIACAGRAAVPVSYADAEARGRAILSMETCANVSDLFA